MDSDRKAFRLNLATVDVEAFLGECEAADWNAVDTGERIMTDEGPDAEAILLVTPLARSRARAARVVAQ